MIWEISGKCVKMVSKVSGIVIKETDAGESGKRIVVLTREHGKMLLSARGAKNAKSGIMAATQLFSYCEFTLFEGRGFYSITQADVIESFYGIRNNFDAIAYGAYILELTERTAFEELADDEAFDLLIRTLIVLSKRTEEARLIACIYIIRLIKECGFMSDVFCAECGEELEGKAYYSESTDGIFCVNCSEGAEYKLSAGALRAIKHISENPLNLIFSFRLDKDTLEEVWTFADVSRRKYFGERYKTLDYINNMKF